MAGCLPLESIQQSTLECLYTQSCINTLSYQSKISRPKPLKIAQSKYPSNLTIGTMFDKNLFVESWENTSSFEVYFNACAPRSLTYSYQGPYRLASIFTICVSAFGGLVVVWRFLIPLGIKLWQFIQWKKQHIQSPNISDAVGIEQAILRMAPKPIDQGEDTSLTILYGV